LDIELLLLDNHPLYRIGMWSSNFCLGGEIDIGLGITGRLGIHDAGACSARDRVRGRAESARPFKYSLPELSHLERMEADPQCS
jgi:hypothetical protein